MNLYADILELVKLFDSNELELKDNSAVKNITDVLCINKISYRIFNNGVSEESKVLFSSKEHELGENYDFTKKSYDEKVIVLRIYRYQYAAPLGDLNDLFNVFAQIISNKVAANENFKACESILYLDQQMGIPNLNALYRHINKLINFSIIQDYYIGYMNIIQCRILNNIFGQTTTDKIIKDFCWEACSYVDEAKDEIFTRLGGDNFVFIVHKDHITDILTKLESIPVSIEQNNDIIEYTINSRIGYSSLNSNCKTISSVINPAALAYSFSRNPDYPNVYLYQDEVKVAGFEEEDYAESIRQALEEEKFLVYYQPIISKNNEELSLYSAEALIRWRRQGEMLNPKTFLQIADKYNLLCKIDLFVLKTVCEKINVWINEGLMPVTIHCNFADNDLLVNNLADKIIEIIDSYNVHHSLINIEFAESAYHNNKNAFIYTVSKLHSAGIKVSVDNFGKGFTSLELFENVDFSTLKIDSVIVNSESAKTRILLSNLINLADNLAIEVICVGANTKNEIERAFESGCDIFQSEVYEKALSERYFSNRLKNPKY